MGMSNGQCRQRKWEQINQGNMVIIKKGQVLKQSKYLKQWRTRNAVLLYGYLATFSPECPKPTALLPIADIARLAKHEQGNGYYLKIEIRSQGDTNLMWMDQLQRDQWFNLIKAQKLRVLKESKASVSIQNEDSQNIFFSEVQQCQL